MENQVQDFLNVLRQRRWQILLPALFTLSLGIAFAAIVPKKFLVNTRIELRESQLGEESATEREAIVAEMHIKHFIRVKSVIEKEAGLWPEYFELSPAKRADFILDVMDALEVFVNEKSKDRGSTFVDISYTDVNADRAERFLGELTSLWIDEVVERQLNAVKKEIEILRGDLLGALNELNEKSQQFSALARDLEIDPTQPVNAKFENRGDIVLRRLESNQERFDKEKIELEGLQAEVIELQDQLAKEPPTIEAPVNDSNEYDRELLRLAGEIKDWEEQQGRVTRANSRWAACQKEIDARLRQVKDIEILRDELAKQTATEPNPEYERLVTEISVLQGDIRHTYAVVESLREEGAELQRLSLARYEDYETLNRLAQENDLAWARVQQLQEARDTKEQELKVMQDAYGRPFDIAQEPEASEKPTEPNPGLIVAVALFLGLGLGLGSAVLAEFARNGFRSVHDLRNVMTVPVLGAVNSIVTRAESRRVRARRTLVGLSSVIVVGSILWVTVTWSLSPDRLPLGLVEAIDGLRKMML